MPKINLLGFTKIELESLAKEAGLNSFHGRQLFKWLYSVRQYDFGLMTDLSSNFREKLKSDYEIAGLELIDHKVARDGTKKLLFRLNDGRPIETVLIPDEGKRRTACISSQAGCAVGCHFCATGTMGLLRDLTIGEIVGQLVFLRDKFGENAFSNVVMMGMGEPLLNYGNVVAAVKIMTDSQGLGISPKKIVLSTSGITPKINKLADEKLGIRLALSLHSASQQKRQRIMPIAKTFKLDNLIEACRYYAETSKQPVTFEYIVFDDFNDTRQDIDDLTRLMKSLNCKINIMAYNPVQGLDFKRPLDEKVNWFGKELNARVKTVTVRKSRGRDIDAACGQLAARNYQNTKEPDSTNRKGKISARV
jgi:23S rRNA (adenine2503-C2)-methyltransferase